MEDTDEIHIQITNDEAEDTYYLPLVKKSS